MAVSNLSSDRVAERKAIVEYLRKRANTPHPVEAGEYALSWMGRGLVLLFADQIERGEHLTSDTTPSMNDTPAPYGYCPICGGLGRSRERRPNGNDRCENGHSYASNLALPTTLSP